MEKKDLLIVGSGGREHALGWKLSKSQLVGKIYYAPGNGGTNENINIDFHEIDKLLDFAKKNDCLTIVGPEEPLSRGIVDSFTDKELPIFGPSREGSRLESSKIFAKEFMNENNIPTADYEYFDDVNKAKDYVTRQSSPLVVKADGLAGGKGVIVCNDSSEALDAIDSIMIKREVTQTSRRIVIEKRIFGEELSFIGLCDGENLIAFDSCQDHKRLLNDDRGPNTGGMGSYSPAPFVDDELSSKIMKSIMIPTIKGMKRRGFPFKGFLYAGLMIDKTRSNPIVLEYNVRMGDPECQSLMVRMESDLFSCISSAINGNLQDISMKWKKKFSACVVIASKGYPGNYTTGYEIHGLDNANVNDDVVVFHAGTKRNGNKIYTSGGRVLSVTGIGDNLKLAISKTYNIANKIYWGKNEQYYRTDIAKRHS